MKTVIELIPIKYGPIILTNISATCSKVIPFAGHLHLCLFPHLGAEHADITFHVLTQDKYHAKMALNHVGVVMSWCSWWYCTKKHVTVTVSVALDASRFGFQLH